MKISTSNIDHKGQDNYSVTLPNRPDSWGSLHCLTPHCLRAIGRVTTILQMKHSGADANSTMVEYSPGGRGGLSLPTEMGSLPQKPWWLVW